MKLKKLFSLAKNVNLKLNKITFAGGLEAAIMQRTCWASFWFLQRMIKILTRAARDIYKESHKSIPSLILNPSKIFLKSIIRKWLIINCQNTDTTFWYFRPHFRINLKSYIFLIIHKKKIYKFNCWYLYSAHKLCEEKPS